MLHIDKSSVSRYRVSLIKIICNALVPKNCNYKITKFGNIQHIVSILNTQSHSIFHYN